jgi:hypothetical protein
MCFSATASFTAAAVTGGLGLATLVRIRHRAEVPLAVIPLIFALQQLIEGMLWLALDGGGDPGLVNRLALCYLLLAEVWWPLFVPIAVLLVEPEPLRRRLMLPVLALGLGVGLYLGWQILSHERAVAIVDEHLVYGAGRPLSFIVGIAYFAATVAPPLLSSRRTITLLGAIVFVGAAIAYISYWEAFVSVWCFFAAAASGVILYHFEWARRQGGSLGV